MADDPPGAQVGEPMLAPGLLVRRAVPGDVDFLANLASHADVAPFVGAGTAAGDRTGLREELERSTAAPREHGRFVIELLDGERTVRAGALAFEEANRTSGIVHLARIMVHPEFRGRSLGSVTARVLAEHLVRDLGYHRVQLECYAFNDRAVRAFERAGFVREGVRRAAYLRHDRWNDAVLLGLVAEDLGPR